MRLANFGMIALDGTVTRPEPGADFAAYKDGLAQYRMMLAIQKRFLKTSAMAAARPIVHPPCARGGLAPEDR